jgi:hypothetical protein
MHAALTLQLLATGMGLKFCDTGISGKNANNKAMVRRVGRMDSLATLNDSFAQCAAWRVLVNGGAILQSKLAVEGLVSGRANSSPSCAGLTRAPA